LTFFKVVSGKFNMMGWWLVLVFAGPASALSAERVSRRSLLAGAVVPQVAMAVSGGGKDFAGSTIKGEDFSNKVYTNKDFSGVDAAGTNFASSKLQGTRFFKADLEGADFSKADLTAASLEGANLKEVTLTDAIAEGAAFSQTLEDVRDIQGADFTDAIIQTYVQRNLCARPDAKGVNPKTKVPTRDSLFCAD